MDALVVVECSVCWARAGTVDEIEHTPVIRHPAEVEYRRYSFPYVMAPTGGLFGGTA